MSGKSFGAVLPRGGNHHRAREEELGEAEEERVPVE